MNRARRDVSRRSGGVCEVCDRAPATDWHHRKNRSQGGQWSASNGLHLCRACHRMVTEQPEAARRWGWAVPSWCDPAEAPVRLLRHGWVRLTDDGRYIPVEVPHGNETVH